MGRFLSSVGGIVKGLFSEKSVSEVSPELMSALAAKMTDENIVCVLRVEKSFHKKVSSFAGETFFRVAAVLTNRRLVLVKDGSGYGEINSFPLRLVSGVSAQSDSGKPAIKVSFADGSENRLVFSSPDPEIAVFESALARVSLREEKFQGGSLCGSCGKQTRENAKFCSECGSPLDFAVSENTMT